MCSDKRLTGKAASAATGEAPRWLAMPLLLLGLGALCSLFFVLYPAPRPMSLLLLIGALLGITLQQSRFSFTASYRRLLLYREIRGVNAQLWMIALATLLFAPALAQGELFGRPVYGALAPLGWQVACGAFLFGVGMQLAGGCGSGTLYTAGAGNPRMLMVLLTFCAGSFWASLDMHWWQQLPALPATTLAALVGWPLAVILQLLVLGGLTLLLRWLGEDRQRAATTRAAGLAWYRRLTAPWPLLLGATILALLNFATLATAGHPWTITWAFSLWGAKAAALLGWVPATNSFWTAPFQQTALQNSILTDTTSVMNLGLLLGAFCAALLSSHFRPRFRLPWKAYLAALIGGLLLGYGARIAFGCNIGALFSGIASTSLHGWLWLAAALPGNWLGIKLRPWFQLAN